MAKPQGTARRARGRRTVHRGSMPSTVRHRCSVLYVFSLYLLLSLFLSPHTPWLSAAGYYILAPALSPGSLFHIGRILVGRSLEARMSLAMIEKGRRRPLPPPRVSLCSRTGKKNINNNKEKRKMRCRATRYPDNTRAIILLIKLNAANSKGKLINDVFA